MKTTINNINEQVNHTDDILKVCEKIHEKNIEQLEKSNKKMSKMIRDGWVKHYTESTDIKTNALYPTEYTHQDITKIFNTLCPGLLSNKEALKAIAFPKDGMTQDEIDDKLNRIGVLMNPLGLFYNGYVDAAEYLCPFLAGGRIDELDVRKNGEVSIPDNHWWFGRWLVDFYYLKYSMYSMYITEA